MFKKAVAHVLAVLILVYVAIAALMALVLALLIGPIIAAVAAPIEFWKRHKTKRAVKKVMPEIEQMMEREVANQRFEREAREKSTTNRSGQA